MRKMMPGKKSWLLNIRHVVIFCCMYIPCIQSAQKKERPTSAPFISGDGFRSIADHIFDETNEVIPIDAIKFADTIFVKTDKLHDFFRNVHKHITTPYILITHNSDADAPGQYTHMLRDANILRWYGQNSTLMNHPKFIPIPIGFENVHFNKNGNVQNFLNINERRCTDPFEKKYLLGRNFRSHTNIPVREKIAHMFVDKPYCHTVLMPIHWDYLEQMAQAKFILSPRGSGLDCHRHWEALLAGAIPIIKSSPLDPLLKDLPVLIIKDWHEINEKFLLDQYARIMEHTAYNFDLLYLSHWQKVIRSDQAYFKETIDG